MISSFSRQISLLESKLDDHERRLRDITQKKSEEVEQKDPNEIPSEIQRILLSFQGELKDQSFVVNTLQSRLHRQQDELRTLGKYINETAAKEEDLKSLREIVIGLLATSDANKNCQKSADSDTTVPKVNLSRQSEAIKSTLNPSVPEFKPRNLQKSQQECRTDTLKSNNFPENVRNSSNSQLDCRSSSDSLAKESSCTGVPVKADTRSGMDGKILCSEMKKEDENPTKCSSGNGNDTACLDGQSSLFAGEVNEKRLKILQQKMWEKDRAIEELQGKLQEAMGKYEQSMQQMEWQEHKLRLLRQDKRRRGETIGKMLRCIDDLRDCGHVDLSRASSERAILTSTLSTRGMPHEERILIAINVTEAEQLHQYRPDKSSPRFGPDGMEEKEETADRTKNIDSQCKR